MCGIIAYAGEKNVKELLVDGLKRLEYRGYDSAGLAIQNGRDIALYRAVGKISELENKINGLTISGRSGIAHTRWATHGEPSEANAHPQFDQNNDVFVAHNGIIENFFTLKKKLEKSGIRFRSQTDTEVIAHLIARFFQGDLRLAVTLAIAQLEGTFGLAVIHRQKPGEIVVARRSSPLIIGESDHGYFAASDAAAFIRQTNKVVELNDNEIATITRQGHQLATTQAVAVSRTVKTIEWSAEEAELNGFPHFMLKEIYEQPETIENAIRGRLETAEGVSKLGGVMPVWDKLKECRNIVIVACGTSFYAGCVGRYIFERLTETNVTVEIASEFRYRKLCFPPNTFVVALSQSGETADTLAGIKEAKRKNAELLGIVNVVVSSIAREAGVGIYNHAGAEIGVASTKNFVSQVAALILLALLIGRHQKLTLTEGLEAVSALQAMPDKIREVLKQSNRIQAIAEKYYQCGNWLFLGRHYCYPIALEGALKLKEVSYIHAEGYAAGEMKHGPIALINPQMPTVAIVPKDALHEKMLSNIEEIKSRRGPIIAIATAGDERIKELADEVIEIPETLDYLTPLLAVVPCQLLAYHCARLLNRDIDKPRNLAKSVTVE